MTDEQKAALEWLDNWFRRVSDPEGAYARTIKAMLAEPRLPKELTEAMFRAFLDGGGWVDCSTNREYLAQSWRTLYAHLTPPIDDLEEIRRYGT